MFQICHTFLKCPCFKTLTFSVAGKETDDTDTNSRECDVEYAAPA